MKKGEDDWNPILYFNWHNSYETLVLVELSSFLQKEKRMYRLIELRFVTINAYFRKTSFQN
ncbi:MAG: hypothetical protein A3F72_20030 [Bacteroidetes bacterium RIFCSPLOWO2_12_FULL_35_15]|nr:MAG: hypothetical protein A3F72_20030 [Bacteroidetes bacterium RIFCSPLOWO2_12_FULL_35_15]